MTKIKSGLKTMKLNLNTVRACGLMLAVAFALGGCEGKQPDFKFIDFHAPPEHVQSVASKHVDFARRAEYKKYLRASGFKISHVGKWIQLDCPRSKLFKTESANYLPHTQARLNLLRAYMSTFSVVGLEVSVYGAPPELPAYEQALTNQCAIEIANTINTRRKNLGFVSATGFGVHNPIALNNTRKGRNTNKRVTIRFELEQADLALI